MDARLEEQKTYHVKVFEFKEPKEREAPPNMVNWQRHTWSRNFYCELCMGVAGPGADVLDCRSCNVVMHYKCVAKRPGGDSLVSSHTAAADWHCELCTEVLASEKSNFENSSKYKRMAFTKFRMAARIQGDVNSLQGIVI